MSTQLKIGFKLGSIFLLATTSIAEGTSNQEDKIIANTSVTGFSRVYPELKKFYQMKDLVSGESLSGKMLSIQEAETLLEKCASLMVDENTPYKMNK